MHTAVIAALVMAGLTPQPNPNASYSYRILNAPTSSDERAIRTQGLQPEAQRRSNLLFGSLAGVLGGTAPGLNFVPTGSPLTIRDTSANVLGQPGAPQGTINVDPLAVEALINNNSPYHNSGVNQYPHEMAHLRQTPAILANEAQREGGAQAFADYVTPTAAQRAGIPYTPTHNDGLYAGYVQQILQRPDALAFILGSQFGHAPVAFP